MNTEINDDILRDLYAWIDKVPLSRMKKNITRDFSDGVMAAEVVKFFFPKLVELHNFPAANSTQQKMNNWATLNRKVFPKLNFHVPEDSIKKIVLSTTGFIEPVLCMLRERIEERRLGKNQDERQDLEYYSCTYVKSQLAAVSIVNTNDFPCHGQNIPSYPKPAPGQMNEKQTGQHFPKVRPEPTTMQSYYNDPTMRLLMEEKEKAMLDLQETAEILQMKVNKLERLVQLKDLRIKDLTMHLEQYKSRANVP